MMPSRTFALACVLATVMAMTTTHVHAVPNYCDNTDADFLARHAAQEGSIPVDPKNNVWLQNYTYYIDVNPDPEVSEYEFLLNAQYMQRQYYVREECAYKYEHVDACGFNTWCATNWTSVVLPNQMLVPGLNGPPDTPRARYKVVPPQTPRYDKLGALFLSFESRALSSTGTITVANVPQIDATAFTEIIKTNVPKQQRSYELVFEADPTTGTPKIKGHFDSKVVPISTLSAGEQSLFSAIDSGSLQQVQDPLGPEGYLVPGHVFTGRSVGNALHPAPFDSARRSPWYRLSRSLEQ